MDKRIKLQLKVNKARYNLMFMAILSTVNILAIFSSGKLIMPFSSAIAGYSAILGNATENNSFKLIGFSVAAAVIAFILLCYFKTKKSDLYFALAFGFTITDTVCLICFSGYIGYLLKTLTILDIAIHILTIVYLFGALKAFRKLSIISKNEEVNDDEDDDDDELAEYIKGSGEILLEGDYRGYNIFVAKCDNDFQLVVNGYICNSTESPTTQNFELSATVNNIDIIFVYDLSGTSTAIFLYANNKLIAEADI